MHIQALEVQVLHHERQELAVSPQLVAQHRGSQVLLGSTMQLARKLQTPITDRLGSVGTLSKPSLLL